MAAVLAVLAALGLTGFAEATAPTPTPSGTPSGTPSETPSGTPSETPSGPPPASSGPLALDGDAGYATTTGPVFGASGAFSVPVRARLDGAALAVRPVGYRGLVASQGFGEASSWDLWVVKTGGDQYVWEFTRTTPSGSTVVTEPARTRDGAGARTDTWTDLTGIFDPPGAAAP